MSDCLDSCANGIVHGEVLNRRQDGCLRCLTREVEELKAKLIPFDNMVAALGSYRDCVVRLQMAVKRLEEAEGIKNG